MRSRIVKIGNSQGIRIPKPLLEEAGLLDEVEMNVRSNTIVIAPAKHQREGWAEAFEKMGKQGDDSFINGIEITESEWDRDEWEW